MITESEALAYLGGNDEPYPLEAVRPAPLRVLEIGSGAGDGTQQIAAAFPTARITCLEPDDAARNALVWRLAGTPGARERISVLPLTLDEADFLGTFDLVVAHRVLCRVAPDERQGFLTQMSRRMGYDGCAIVDDYFGPDDNDDAKREMVSQARFGEFTYSRWFSAQPVDRRERHVLNEYVVTDRRGDVVHQSRHESVEWVADRELMLALIRAAGMVPTGFAQGWLRLATP